MAAKLVKDQSLYCEADEYLLDHRWVKIYRGSFMDHKWHINWRKFLTEQQKIFLRPIFCDPDIDIYAYCRDDFEKEEGEKKHDHDQ